MVEVAPARRLAATALALQPCEVVTLSNAEGPTIARAWLPEDATEGDELVLEIADASVVETLAVAPLEPLTLKVRVVARPS